MMIMPLIRFIIIGFFSYTALGLLVFQAVEIWHAVINLIQDHH
jgi:hypothetical protein